MKHIKTITPVIILILQVLVASHAQADQQHVHGRVYELEEHHDHHHMYPLIGAHVVWLGTNSGVTTDEEGAFDLPVSVDLPHEIVVSYIGYQSDTLMIENANEIVAVVLEASTELDEVEVTGRRPGAHVSSLDPVLTNVITDSEMQRAACCNLAEAFETNVSVDVNYSDAVSGAQQIQMLGLAGTYSQLMLENMPGIRGLGEPFGLTYIPGPWMESISVSKGAASVVNGYESITGQINVDLKKPEGDERFYFNAFAADHGQLESSVNAAFDLNPNWSTMVMAHGEYFDNKIDHNHNTFLDHPLVKKYNILNRYRYDRPGVMDSQFGFNLMQEERQGGQKDFFTNGSNFGSGDYYGYGTNTTRFQAFARTGFYFDDMPDASLGTQLSFTHHGHDSHYGMDTYDGEQNTLYANALFGNTIRLDHEFVAGVSFLYDDFEESLNDSIFDRQEVVPGAFFEYTYHTHERFTAVAAFRADYHNLYGTLLTPRAHLHFNLHENTTIRASAGKGYRAPNLIAENTGLLVSNRQIIIAEEIDMEEAWNYGGSITQRFRLFGNEASLVGEFYRTNFVNQLIVDVDSDHHSAIFHNLRGDSYANNFQVELNAEPIRFLEFTAAYRHTDAKMTIGDELRRKPFTNRYRGMLSASYATRSNDWQFDLTAQFNGPSRVPDVPASSIDMHHDFEWRTESPSYTIMNAQVTYRWQNLDIYVGGENLTDFYQKDPILNPQSPFEEGFDGSMIWGPLMGRKFYMGVRFSIDRS